MARLRLRPAWTPEQLDKIYAKQYNGTQHADHRIRIQVTMAVAAWYREREVVGDRPVRQIADLSCGDRTIYHSLANQFEARWTLGDITATDRPAQLVGPIEQTIDQIEPVDLFILSETLEHLDDPDAVLAKIRGKAQYLILSTPIGEDNDDNWEHYWGWGVDDVGKMLTQAGFTAQICNHLYLPDRTYDFQIWGCH